MTNPLPDNLTFEQALTELERIVHELEDSQTGLEEALDRYEQGIGLIKHCYAQLRQAEQRILLLTGTDESGQPTLKPFEHSATAENPVRPPARGPGDPPIRRLPQNKD
ncbi:MAG TPA: exodeoxyribonuclease VII small subunit [Gemmataceae bacterium]|nr:exodeoxyribonuclease VII small subunit [Gemmataceae bacterium]